MEYAYSYALGDDEWASTIDESIRTGRSSKSDFGPHRCVECKVAATMVAVGENPASPNGEYVTQPHFRIKHTASCEVSGQELLVRGGVQMSATTQPPSGSSFPAKFDRPDQREVVDDEGGTDPPREPSEASDSAARAHAGGLKPRSVRTLLPVCTHFVSYKQIGFAGRSLELPKRDADEYAYRGPYAGAFRRLRADRYIAEAPSAVVYADLMFAESPEVTDSYIALPLFAGSTEEGSTRPKQPHRLRIEWSAWSKQRRESLRDRIEHNRARAKLSARNKTESIVVFAYPQRALVETTDLVVDDTADFCVIAVQRGWDRRA